VRVVVAVFVVAPLVPVIVSVEEAAGVLLLVVTVSVELPAPVTVAGENVPVAPDGKPLTLKFTALLKPPDTAILVV
jgi:hypothetical protein